MNNHKPDIVVIGASAGGVSALRSIVQALPSSLPAACFIVLHIHPQSESLLPSLLDGIGGLPAKAAVDGDTFEHGQVYVAPPDRHMTLEGQQVRVTLGPAQNHHRPSIDVLFRSAAVNYGPRVLGVVLTGFLSDGTAGLAAIKESGGMTLVQDPKTAQYPDMPLSALRTVAIDHCVPLDQIGPLIVKLISQSRGPQTSRSDTKQMKVHRFEAQADLGNVHEIERYAEPSSYLCPDCGGGLWELQDSPTRFRCRVGHGYSLNDLASSQDAQVESALWAATRSLEDRTSLSRKLAEEWRARGSAEVVEHFTRKAEESHKHAETLRALLGVPSSAKRG